MPVEPRPVVSQEDHQCLTSPRTSPRRSSRWGPRVSVTPVAEGVTGSFDSYVSFSVDSAEVTILVAKEIDRTLHDNGFHAIAVC